MDPCCCVTECIFHSDDFVRDDNGPGGDYTVKSGDWHIDDNDLVERGTSGSILLLDILPFSQEVVIRTELVSGAGRKFRVIVNYQDSANYLFADFKDNTTDWIVTVGSRVATSETILDTSGGIIGSESTQVEVCFSGTTLSASSDGEHWAKHCQTQLGPGKTVGLGNQSNVEIAFDDFAVENHYVVNPDCSSCVCHCERQCIDDDDEVLATFEADGTCETFLDGLEITLVRGANECATDILMPFDSADLCFGGTVDIHNGVHVNTFGLFLICDDIDSDDWKMCFISDDCTNGIYGIGDELDFPCTEGFSPVFGGGAVAASKDCNPFEMVFGPFNVVSDEPPEGFCTCHACRIDPAIQCAGSFTITVTRS